MPFSIADAANLRFQSGRQRGLSGALVGGGGGPASEPITFSVLDPMATTTNRTAIGSLSYATLSPTAPIQGSSGSLAMDLNGSSGDVTIQTTNFAWPGPVGPDDLFVMAIDVGDDPLTGTPTSTRLTVLGGATYSEQSDTTNGVNQSLLNHPVGFGRRYSSVSAWAMRAGSWAGANITAQGAANVTLRVALSSNYNGDGPVRVGPIYRVTQRRKPMWVCTLDDNHAAQRTDLFPAFAARGLVATCYAAVDWIGISARWNLAQAMEMKAGGWSFGLNSGPGDEPLQFFGSVAQAITGLNAHRAALVATGLATDAESRHLCFSYGPSSVGTTHSTVTGITTNGTDTVVTTGSFFSSFIFPGMRVKGVNVPPGTTVLDVCAPTPTTAILSASIPSGTTSLTFCGISHDLVCVTNDTAVVTSINTTGLVPGMRLQGRFVPPGTTIVSVDIEGAGGQITASAPIPTGCVRITGILDGLDWLPNRMEQALLAAGYLSARRGAIQGGICTQFGADPRAMIGFQSAQIEADTALRTIAAFERDMENGRDVVTVGHFGAPDMTRLNTILDWVQARVAAGDMDCVNLHQWYARVMARSGPV